MPRISGINSEIEMLTTEADIGMFDVGYEISATRKQMQPVVDWMAQNCTNNFIVTETASRIAAGGYVDNKIPWKKGRFNLSRKPDKDDFHDHLHYPNEYEYRIKLSTYDNVMFRMVWIEEDQKNDR